MLNNIPRQASIIDSVPLFVRTPKLFAGPWNKEQRILMHSASIFLIEGNISGKVALVKE
jgi:hypothetical protein